MKVHIRQLNCGATAGTATAQVTIASGGHDARSVPYVHVGLEFRVERSTLDNGLGCHAKVPLHGVAGQDLCIWFEIEHAVCWPKDRLPLRPEAYRQAVAQALSAVLASASREVADNGE